MHSALVRRKPAVKAELVVGEAAKKSRKPRGGGYISLKECVAGEPREGDCERDMQQLLDSGNFARPFVHPGVDACHPEVGKQTDTKRNEPRCAGHRDRYSRRERMVMEYRLSASSIPYNEDTPTRDSPYRSRTPLSKHYQ